MTVCLTGDVHHMSLDTRDQVYLEASEVDATLGYVEIAASYDLPVTLFLTGLAAREEPARVERLAAADGVEIGGHNYYAFSTPVHKLWRGLTGSWNGPRRFQAWEIRRTIDALEGCGATVRSWRDHAYRHDDETADLLASHGITHFSDVVDPAGAVERGRPTVVPVNTPPDHEHVYHAFRTPAFVEEDGFEGPFGTESVHPDEWVEWVLDAVAEHREAGRTATVLAHPACMRLADEMAAFDRLCDGLSAYEAVTVREV
ncbi:polysaccharide deacetylase family protein [Halomarina pelagica]|uniref:polysaccharide deacetylase family protein n=1 Tax=Halomarina pelagica TaxID=2961599 RepID=UPI0020C42C3A|nr:polysaccharide deacetylase family protein [Halomarina sp. BND7]